MKIKKENFCGKFAWSPYLETAEFLVAGTVAGSMSEDFHTDSHLNVYRVNSSDASPNLAIIASIEVESGITRIAWTEQPALKHGLLGIASDGLIRLINPEKIIDEHAKANDIVSVIEAHEGAITSFQFNPTQTHLLATGGQDKALRIWSLQNHSNPVLSLCPTTQRNPHLGEISDLCWHPKIAHILATSTQEGCVYLWDLRAKKCSATFHDSSCKSPALSLAWHPEKTTQLAVAKDHATNNLQLWDLRKSLAPIQLMKGHTAGILDLSWSAYDPNLLLSGGKDGKTICWNPNQGEIITEFPEQTNWVFQSRWSSHMPSILAISSYDTGLGVYSFWGRENDSSEWNSLGTNTAPRWLYRESIVSTCFGGDLFAYCMPKPSKSEEKESKHALQTISTHDNGTVVEKEGEFSEIREALISNNSIVLRDATLARLTNYLSVENEEGYVDPLIWRIFIAILEGKRCFEIAELIHPQENTKVTPPDALGPMEDLPADKTGSVKVQKETDRLIQSCLCRADISGAIKLCFKSKRYADGLMFSQIATPKMQRWAEDEYISHHPEKLYLQLLLFVREKKWDHLMNIGLEQGHWREILSLCLCFGEFQETKALCEKLASRLEKKWRTEIRDQETLLGAQCCQILAGNVQAVFMLWCVEYIAHALGMHRTMKAIREVNDGHFSPESLIPLHTKTRLYYRPKKLQKLIHRSILIEFILQTKISTNLFCDLLEEYTELLLYSCKPFEASFYVRYWLQHTPTESPSYLKALSLQKGLPRCPYDPSGMPSQQTSDVFHELIQKKEASREGTSNTPLEENQLLNKDLRNVSLNPTPSGSCAIPSVRAPHLRPDSNVETQRRPELSTQKKEPHHTDANIPVPATAKREPGKFVPMTASKASLLPPSVSLRNSIGPTQPNTDFPVSIPGREKSTPKISNTSVLSPATSNTTFRERDSVTLEGSVSSKNDISSSSPFSPSLVSNPTLTAKVSRGASVFSSNVPPSSTSSALESSFDCLRSTTVDISNIVEGSSEHEAIFSLTKAIQRLTDERKRRSVDKALTSLFQAMNAHRLETKVLSLIERYSQVIGTNQAKIILAELSTLHWDQFRPFLCIKFLE